MKSTLPVSRWHEPIVDRALADGILDRLVHNAHRVEMRTYSMRKIRPKESPQDLLHPAMGSINTGRPKPIYRAQTRLCSGLAQTRYFSVRADQFDFRSVWGKERLDIPEWRLAEEPAVFPVKLACALVANFESNRRGIYIIS